MSAVIISLAAAPALAESPAPAPQASADAATTTITLDTIEIISQELNAARLQIQPSAEYCLRVARRMSLTIRSEDDLGVPDFWIISTP
jgi:hypothetical protein